MKTAVRSGSGYDIPVEYNIRGDEKRICIIAHGFASSKQSSTAQLMLKHLPGLGMGAAAFDFPCHGESGASHDMLTVDRCLEDLAAVERWAASMADGAEIVYFGSSFGAYCTICHLCSGKSLGRRAFLRCAAVDMDRTFGVKTEEMMGAFAEKGYCVYDPGFGEGLKLTEEFFDTLKAHSPFELELPQGAELYMIHGLEDTVVSPESAKSYAEKVGCPIALVPHTGHGIDSEEGIETLLRLTSDFFGRE